MPLIFHVPLAQLEATCAPPFTRESVIDLARRISNGTAREVHIVVTVDHEDDGLAIELATVEVSSMPDGIWRLQYVSHPAQSLGLTREIVPCKSDFLAYIQVRELLRLPRDLSPNSAQEMEDEGLGPLDALNLRPNNPAPVVPSKADLYQFMELAGLKPTLSVDAGQSNRGGPGCPERVRTVVVKLFRTHQ